MNRLTHRESFWRLVLPLGDLLAAGAAFFGAFAVRIELPLPWTLALLPLDRLRLATAGWGIGLALAGQLLLLYFFGFYDPPEPRSRLETARRLLAAVGVQGVLLVSVYFLIDLRFPRTVLLLYLLLDFALVFGWRGAVDRLRRPAGRRVVLVGSGPAAVEVAEKIHASRWRGLDLAGFVVPPDEAEPADPRAAAALGRRLGTVEDLPSLLAAGIDDVILAPSGASWQTRLVDRLAAQRPAHATVLLLPGPFESLIGRMRYRWVHDLPLIEVVRESEWRLNRPLKRAFDLAGAAILGVLALPLLAVSAALVAATSRGPVFYRQERIGRGRRPFTLWKLRTMTADAEGESEEVLAQPDDPRRTPVGGVLRRLRLDELPQLANVLNGTMSLVGPRPERPGFVERYLSEIPGYAERFSLAPGLTGLAQINGEYLSSAQNKLRYDLAYLANWSLWLDLSILFRTIKIVLTSRGT